MSLYLSLRTTQLIYIEEERAGARGPEAERSPSAHPAAPPARRCNAHAGKRVCTLGSAPRLMARRGRSQPL